VPFRGDLHLESLLRHEKADESDAIGKFTNEHLKISGAYWCIGSLKLLKKLDSEKTKNDMITFTKACQNENGGFGGNIGHDAHISSSLYALLVLAMFDSVKQIDTDRLAVYVSKL
jgi:geranylgeranyl transferase type-2 subunit beta